MLFDVHGQAVTDTWYYPEQEAAEQQAVSQRILPLASWIELEASTGELAGGVWVPSDQDIAALTPVLDKVQLVAIGFTQTRDGRGFTLAKLLRERHAFKGDIRAVGPLLPDQFVMLLQCGFSSVATSVSGADARWAEAAHTYKHQQHSPLTLLHRLRNSPNNPPSAT